MLVSLQNMVPIAVQFVCWQEGIGWIRKKVKAKAKVLFIFFFFFF